MGSNPAGRAGGGAVTQAERPRIAFLAGVLSQGGAERQLFYHASTLQERGYAVRVMTLKDGYWGDRLREAGIPVSVLGGGGPLRRTAAALRELRAAPVDVLQGVHFYVSPYVCLISRLVGAVGVCAVASRLREDLRKLPAPAGAACLRGAHVLAANSRAALDEARARGVPERRLLYRTNVVDARLFRPPDSGALPARPRLLAVGRLEPAKRFDRFVRLVAALRRSRDVEAALVGDGSERPRLEALAASLGLEPPALRIGPAEADAAAHYQQASVLIQTSEVEGMPNVVLEAMACGLPVVATAVGGTPEAVEDGVTGLLVRYPDEAGVQAGVERLLDNPALVATMGEHGRRRVETYFSLADLGPKLDELYARVMSLR